MQNFEVWLLLLDNETISGSHFSSFLHILPLKQFNGWISIKVWKDKLFYSKCWWIIYFCQIFNLFGCIVINLSLSEIPIWTHQRQFGLKVIITTVTLNRYVILTLMDMNPCEHRGRGFLPRTRPPLSSSSPPCWEAKTQDFEPQSNDWSSQENLFTRYCKYEQYKNLSSLLDFTSPKFTREFIFSVHILGGFRGKPVT